MRDERHWQPVEVIWDEDRHEPPPPPFPFQRGQSFPSAPPLPAERTRPQRQTNERPALRDGDPDGRRGRERPKRGRKKLRPHDFDDFDDA